MVWYEFIYNLGGVFGVWFVDIFFFIFGVMVYIILVIIIGGCWFVWWYQENDEYIDYFVVFFCFIGVLVLILIFCGLVVINVDDIWYFVFGGVIGSLLSIML